MYKYGSFSAYTVCSDKFKRINLWPDTNAKLLIRLDFPEPGLPSSIIGFDEFKARIILRRFLLVVGASNEKDSFSKLLPLSSLKHGILNGPKENSAVNLFMQGSMEFKYSNKIDELLLIIPFRREIE